MKKYLLFLASFLVLQTDVITPAHANNCLKLNWANSTSGLAVWINNWGVIVKPGGSCIRWLNNLPFQYLPETGTADGDKKAAENWFANQKKSFPVCSPHWVECEKTPPCTPYPACCKDHPGLCKG